MRKIVLDVLKPHMPSIVDLAIRIASLGGTDDVNITSLEIDQSTESVKILVAGKDIDVVEVREVIEALGAVIHSVDEVAVTRRGSSS